MKTREQTAQKGVTMKTGMKRAFSGIAALTLIAATLTALCACEEKNPEQYNTYICADHHLESLKISKNLGLCERTEEDVDYDFHYWKIKGLSDTQFVKASSRLCFPMGIMAGDYYYVLQNPENNVDVLHDWTVKEIQLYRWSVPEKDEGQDTEEKSVLTMIETSTDSALIEAFHTLTSKEAEESYEDYNSEEYDQCQKGELRILFEESENLVWISECRLYQSKKDPTSYAVTLDLGEGKQQFPHTSYSVYGYMVAINGELESFIRQTLLEAVES